MNTQDAIAEVREAVERVNAARRDYRSRCSEDGSASAFEWGLAWSDVCEAEDLLSHTVAQIEIVLAHIDALEADRRRLRVALEALKALVEGECPSLLEDNHHFEIAFDALKLSRSMDEQCAAPSTPTT